MEPVASKRNVRISAAILTVKDQGTSVEYILLKGYPSDLPFARIPVSYPCKYIQVIRLVVYKLRTCKVLFRFSLTCSFIAISLFSFRTVFNRPW